MIDSISPLDGRYASKVKELSEFFSEKALIRSRVAVEVEWLVFLTNKLNLDGTHILTEAQIKALRKLYNDFQDEFAHEIKQIESETNHDVKAVEYFLRKAIKALKREDLRAFIHFACTSEDINNLSYGKMLKLGLDKVIVPNLENLLKVLAEFTEKNKNIPMMSHTHGQPASPTTVGKEFKNVAARMFRQIEALKKTEIFGKINGATGNYNAHILAYPNIDWPKASKEFVEHLGLKWQKLTTQIEPHDYLAEIFDNLKRINVILIDFNKDIWAYISMNYLKQKAVKGEVGSSTMPHKVNPIDFENSEGNLGLANALLAHMSEKLPISRLQRDLSDSTVLRNMGSALAYSLLAYKSTLAGLNKIEVNESKLQEDLNNNWALLTEGIQTVMRRYGYADAYEQLKELSRGKGIGKNEIQNFIKKLKIPENAKKDLLKLSPQSYIGLSNKL